MWSVHVFGKEINYRVHFIVDSRPNIWVRFWQRLFFNWKWVNDYEYDPSTVVLKREDLDQHEKTKHLVNVLEK